MQYCITEVSYDTCKSWLIVHSMVVNFKRKVVNCKRYTKKLSNEKLLPRSTRFTPITVDLCSFFTLEQFIQNKSCQTTLAKLKRMPIEQPSRTRKARNAPKKSLK